MNVYPLSALPVDESTKQEHLGDREGAVCYFCYGIEKSMEVPRCIKVSHNEQHVISLQPSSEEILRFDESQFSQLLSNNNRTTDMSVDSLVHNFQSVAAVSLCEQLG